MTDTTTPALTLSSYQERASATADPRAYDLEYLIPAIIGEVGELFGQTAKAHWHVWPAQKLQMELISEYGDICWMTALLLKREGITAQPAERMYHIVSGQSIGHHAYSNPWTALLSSAMSLHKSESGLIGEPLGNVAHWLWVELEVHCKEVTGVSLEQVLRANLGKLADRAARGVLKGQGDHR